MAWSREQESKLRELWDAGETASEIAKALPPMPATTKKPAKPVTRDMVIGKARRMGLEPRPSPIKREEPAHA